MTSSFRNRIFLRIEIQFVLAKQFLFGLNNYWCFVVVFYKLHATFSEI